MPPTITDSDISYVYIPDTQFYSENDNGIFETMTQWVVDNASTYNIEAVVHVGDLVDNDTTAQYDVAETAIDTLDNAGLPTLLALGNHDAANIRNPTTFRSRFPTSRYDGLTSGTYEGHPENAYFTLTLGGRDLLFLTLEFGPRQEVVDWADGVLDSYSGHDVVLVTHSYLFHDGSRVTSGDANSPTNYFGSDFHNGSELWDELVSQHGNVRAVHSGHHIGGPPTARHWGYSEKGNHVHEYFHNYQNETANGGDGWLEVVTLDTDTMTGTIEEYTPHLDSWKNQRAVTFRGWSRTGQDTALGRVEFAGR